MFQKRCKYCERLILQADAASVLAELVGFNIGLKNSKVRYD